MPKRRRNSAAAEVGGDLYTIGGDSPDDYLVTGDYTTEIQRLSCTSGPSSIYSWFIKPLSLLD